MDESSSNATIDSKENNDVNELTSSTTESQSKEMDADTTIKSQVKHSKSKKRKLNPDKSESHKMSPSTKNEECGDDEEHLENNPNDSDKVMLDDISDCHNKNNKVEIIPDEIQTSEVKSNVTELDSGQVKKYIKEENCDEGNLDLNSDVAPQCKSGASSAKLDQEVFNQDDGEPTKLNAVTDEKSNEIGNVDNTENANSNDCKTEETDCKEIDQPLEISELEEKGNNKIEENERENLDNSEISLLSEDKDSCLEKIPTDEIASDDDTPTLAILDVRTVCDEDRLSDSEEKVPDDSKDESEMESFTSEAERTIESGESQPEEKPVTLNEKEIQEEASVEVASTDVEDSDAIKSVDDVAVQIKAAIGTVNSKRLQGKQCLVCEKVKSCKYQVLMLNVTRYLCDDNCFSVFRNKTRTSMKSVSLVSEPSNENRPITRSLTNPKDVCNVCHKDIKNGMGLLPGIGENKPLCSEECMKTYQAEQGLKRACAQCEKKIQSRTKCLTWEAMEFCNEVCLGKYQLYLGSHCAFCNKAVQQTYMGKYCVRFGLDIKQFCSNNCLEEFKSGLKVCSYCQKDISVGPEGFLAPVGDKGQFKEFCTQSCMEKFELMGSASLQPSFKKCSMCKKLSSVNVEVTFEGKEHKLCSESCVAAFRYANKINTSICDTCHKFFDLDVSKQMTIQFEGSSKRFCSKACMNVFVLYHRKVVPCSWCRVKKYNFDMIERVDSNNHVQLFCSLNCLSLFRVSLNATSARRVQCDYCRQVKPAQFHLTMSDASIRNFCTLNCAMHFQGQFNTVAPVLTASSTASTDSIVTNNASGTTKAAALLTAGTPIISSVVSLAPTSSSQQTTTAPTSQTTKAVFVMSATNPVTTSTNVAVSKPIVVKNSIATQTPGVTVSQQVVIKPPAAKSMKNKAVTCRPIMQTKGMSCKPHPCHKNIQTDEVRQDPVLIPVPVPIFVPVPMRMYTTPVPVPLPFPLPIPVPIFIPTTKNSAHGIFKQIKEIQHKIPDNPFEADLILMAEMVAEDSKDKKSKLKAIKQSESLNLEGSEGESFGAESAQPESCQTPNAFGDDVLQMALRIAENVDLEAALSSSNALSHNQGSEENGGEECVSGRQLRSVSKNKRSNSRGRARGRKKAKIEETSENTMPASPVLPSSLTSAYGLHTVLTPQIESNCVLKYSYGVNAWKHWVLQKNNQLEKATGSHRKLKLFKTDLLQLTAEELCFSLCLFVKEVRKPNSEEYAPDSIYYLCLGIQQYLFENGRIDNIFSDAYYEKFTISLNEVLQRYELNLSHDASTGLFLSRIEEEILWESKQLGAHSPHVLLNTLMYFNTKYFLLKTVEDHLQLSFSHILKHWKKAPGGKISGSGGGVGSRNVLLRYYPPSQQKESNRRKKESLPAYEQVENVENPLRCPVKLYEFYLSKCSPESIKSRNDVFYLYPERSCVPDSPVWYSTMPLGRESIAKMLQRIRMVREVGEAIMAAS